MIFPRWKTAPAWGICAALLFYGGACKNLDPGSDVESGSSDSGALKPNAPQLVKDGKPLFHIRDIKIGTGKEAGLGDHLKLHYSAWLFDLKKSDFRGKRFETTREGKDARPYEFVLGEGRLILGWEQGFFGFREGGLRELTVPAEYGFGSEGDVGKVPPNTAIVYELELLQVEKPQPAKLPIKSGTSRPRTQVRKTGTSN